MKTWRHRLVMVLILCGAGTALSLDPNKTINQYGHDVWRRENGLPSNGVNVCLQTRDGYLWIGTSAGIFRFDGVRFEGITTNPETGNARETVVALFESRDSTLWIGTAYSGLRSYKNGVIKVVGEAEGLVGRQIRVLFESREGYLWVGTSNGLFRGKDGRFTQVQVDQTFFTGIAEDHEGHVWAGTHDGVRVFDDATAEVMMRLSVEDGLNDRTTTAVLGDREGDIWIGTTHGFAKWSKGRLTLDKRKESPLDKHATSMLEDREGNLWFGTLTGLYRLTRNQWSIYRSESGLSHDQVLCLAGDREGSLWVGTLEGLNRFKDVNIVPYTVHEGLADDYVSGIAQTLDGSIYFFGNASGEYTRFKDGRMTAASLPIGPAYASHDGGLWIAQTGVLTYVKDGVVTRYDTRNGLLPKWISAVTEDDHSIIIFFDHTGLRRFSNGRMEPYLLSSGKEYSSTEYVECFYHAPDGILWVGTTGGLVRIMDGDSTVFRPSDGLADSWINSIYDDRQGNLWLGSAHGGLTRYRDGKFTAYTTKNGLFSNEIYSVLGDDAGDLWMSSPVGIGHVSQRDLDDLDAGRTSMLHSRVYTTADGMKTDACFDEWQPGALKAQDGRLWFATKKGAVVIDPRRMAHNDQPPPVIIEEMNVDQRNVTLAGPIRLEPSTEKLEFHYAALSLLVPERVLFRYKLEGYDREWVDAGTRRVAYYTNLPPGKYRFRVMACNNDGVWNETGAAVEFVHLPNFSETPWFMVFCVLAAGLAIFGAYRLRVRSLRTRERQLESLVQTRTRELQHQRSFLREVIDLNPSFIFAKDLEGKFTLANRALAQAYGTSVDELLGKTDGDFGRRPDEVEKVAMDDREVLQSNAEKFIPEEEFTTAQGERRWMQTIKMPLSSEDGSAPQLLGVATDITLQKEAKEAAEAATRSKSEFLANMSHEIRTPMNAVIGMTGLLIDTPLSSEQREFVEIIRGSSDTLLTIINDILDFSKIESGRLDLERQPFSIVSCIEESLDLLSPRAVEKGLELAYLLDENTPHDIVGDVTRLRQILVNLVGNAVKFTHRGEVVISVVSRRLDGSQCELEFSVRDTGIGIPKERMDRLFKSFSQVDSSTTRQYGGTGLGLAISRRLSELMGGRMWVESKEGVGSTFRFTIVGSAAPTAPKLHLRREQPQLAGKRLLIVDDNETNRRILTLQTQSWGMKPLALSGGEEALELMRTGEHFELAILDMQMPDMDGATLSAELRKLPGGRELPLVMLTSLAGSARQIREEFGELEFAAYLTKPIKPSQLFDVIMSIFGNKRIVSRPGNEPPRLDKAMGDRLPLRILLAEDNAVNQKVALRVLERFGYRADVASNGVEAVDAVNRQPYDVVLMDVQMPVMDGLEAARRICAEHPQSRPRIIAMTANASQGDRDECLAAGMDDFISKPVKVEELQAMLAHCKRNHGS